MNSPGQTQQRLKADQLQQDGVDQASRQNLDAAIGCWQQALEIYRRIGARQGEGNVLGNLALGHHFAGNYTH